MNVMLAIAKLIFSGFDQHIGIPTGSNQSDPRQLLGPTHANICVILGSRWTIFVI